MSKKNVNVWGNYKIEVPKKEIENSTISEVQTSKLSEFKNSTTPKVQTSEISEVQNYTTPEVQSSTNSQLQNYVNANYSVKSNTKNVKKRKLSYRDMGWLQLTSYLSPKARRKLDDKAYKEKRDMSLILDELILNHL